MQWWDIDKDEELNAPEREGGVRVRAAWCVQLSGGGERSRNEKRRVQSYVNFSVHKEQQTFFAGHTEL